MGDDNLWTKSNDRVLKVQCKNSESEKQADIVELQRRDQELQELLKKWSHKIYCDKEGLILDIKKDAKDDTPTLVVPGCLRKELVMLLHSQIHFGQEKTWNHLSSVGWWPNMIKDMEQCLWNCLNCAENNSDHRINKGPMLHQKVIGPWAHLQIDFIGPLPQTSSGNKYALMIIDPLLQVGGSLLHPK